MLNRIFFAPVSIRTVWDERYPCCIWYTLYTHGQFVFLDLPLSYPKVILICIKHEKNSCAFKLYCPALNPRHICVQKDIWETFEFALSKFTCWKQKWKGSKKVRWIFPCIEYMWSLSCLLYIAELGCVYLETFVFCMHLIVMIYYINFVYHKLRDVFLF